MNALKPIVRLRAALGVSALLFSVSGVAHFSHAALLTPSQTTDATAIESVVGGSLVAEQRADIRPDINSSIVSSAQRVDVFMANVPEMSSAQVASWHTHISSLLEGFYAGLRLAQLRPLMFKHADEEVGAGVTDVELAGGASDIQFTSLSVKGDSASVVVEATKWLKFADHSGTRVTIISPPPSRARYTYALVQTGEGWRISALTGFTILTNAP